MFDTFMPAGILFIILLLLGTRETTPKATPVNVSDKTFLLLMGFGPFLLTIILSAIAGMKLRAGWGQPLMSLWGVILFAYIQPNISIKQFYRFSAVLFLLLMISISGYCIALTRADKPSSANYPGKFIATTLTDTWHKSYHTPVAYIAGTRWLTGNVSLYSDDHPAVYID
jgi:hypothetical protein